VQRYIYPANLAAWRRLCFCVVCVFVCLSVCLSAGLLQN